MRYAGIKTKQIAIALSFVTTALLVSRLSNMIQAAFLGNMVDKTVNIGTITALAQLEGAFRLFIFISFIGSLVGLFFAPTMTILLQKLIKRFLISGSFPKVLLSAFHPRNIIKIINSFQLPKPSHFKGIQLKTLPKSFLIFNIFVTAIYTIGVLCALLAGAYLPELRATAIQLSGIVNGIATILFALVVDPSGARITDQAAHGNRPESDVKSVVFFLICGRLIGTLIIAQLLLLPLTQWVMWVTTIVSTYF
tara:strand:+ start:2153 stop:2905 length:753 start_codon:yes stop_codon:yes gene_type:complete